MASKRPWYARVRDLLAPVRLPEPLPVRPRYGTLVRRDGTTIPLVFHPHPSKPGVFRGVHAGDEAQVVMRHGDQVTVDVIGPGQAVEMWGGLD